MNYYKNIESYCDGEMSPQDIIAFEQAMKEDNELEKAVNLYKNSKKIAEGFLELDIMDTINRLEANDKVEIDGAKDISTGKTGIKIFSMRKLVIAASFIGLLGMGVWWINMMYSDKALIQNFYYPPQLKQERGDESDMQLQQLNKLWNDKAYHEIIAFVHQIDSTKNDTYYSYMEAYAQYKLNHFDKAKEIFSDDIFNNHPPYNEQAQWFLVLIEIQQGHYENANQTLDKIIKDKDQIYHNQAIELKHKLNSTWRKLLR